MMIQFVLLCGYMYPCSHIGMERGNISVYPEGSNEISNGGHVYSGRMY